MRNVPSRILLLALPILFGGCKTPAAVGEPNPKQGEVRLPSASKDWGAFLILDNAPTGVWTVESFPVFPFNGCPQVVGLDDRGRCLVCVSYSGKWTPFSVIEDGRWLGGLAHDDLDPRIEGAELYTGGANGNLYQVVPYANGALDYRRIAALPGQEIHTLVAGELDPRNRSRELLVFTRPGGLYRVTPTGDDGRFETEFLQEVSGRVRQAAILPSEPGEVAVVNHAGAVELLKIEKDGPNWTTISKDSMGHGRLALRPARLGKTTVLYATLDDGRVLRHERLGPDSWKSETIYLGLQGPRGIAAGQFHKDPAVETVAVFGYGKTVQLLSRSAKGWTVEDLFLDRDKGHWLCAAELDGRNGTDEIVGSGYGGRIFLLARPPGTGRPGLLVDPKAHGK